MHVREPHDFEEVRSQRRLRHRLQKVRRMLMVLLVIVFAGCLLAYASYLRPLPALIPKAEAPSVVAAPVALSWPSGGQAAIGVPGQGVLADTPAQHTVPTASVAKAMTALAVLKKHPLQADQPGPTITMTDADVERYNNYLTEDGSVVRVVAGEQISQQQALEAMLLPSANNMADSLAVWAYGSMDAYHTAANQLAASLGMTQSTFAGDASGFSSTTQSTPHDLVLLGQALLNEPALKAIVAMPSATVPEVGVVTNTNVLLDENGVIGIKTGNTEQAGGCYLFAAQRQVQSGQTVTAVGAIQGTPTLGQAMTDSKNLLDSFYQNFASSVVVPKGTVVGHYQVPWNHQTVNVVTTQDIQLFNWRGSKPDVKDDLHNITAAAVAGTTVGTVMASSSYDKAQVSAVTTTSTGQPTWQWRIWRH